MERRVTDREGDRGRADRRGRVRGVKGAPPPTLWHTVNDVPQAEEMTELGGKTKPKQLA